MVFKPKILVYDIETAGVNALNADLGYVITFGYMWLDDFEKGKKAKTISIADYPEAFKKNPHNDKEIVRGALEIISEAHGIIHHYGNRFDAPFLTTRAEILNLQGFPDIPMLDTCFLAYKRLKLSSNRLKNVAKVFNCKYQKLEKGDGWPKWWLEYLKGSSRYDKLMREYCAYDVMTLAEISLRMRKYWPKSFINRLFPKQDNKCKHCGSTDLQRKGIAVIARQLKQNFRCKNCGARDIYQEVANGE